MVLGKLGDVIFEVSDTNVVTYSNLTRKTSATYSTHKSKGEYPRLEFNNPEVRTLSLEITLTKTLMDDDPLELSQIINEYILKGEVVEFIIGTSYVSSGRFVIKDSSETFKVMNGERVDVLGLSLNLIEYIDDDSINLITRD